MTRLIPVVACLSLFGLFDSILHADENPVVLMKTTMGDFEIELFKDKAPITVENFLGYVKSGFYDGTLFHRVIPDFIIQGGGFEPGVKRKKTKPPIKNEAANGLINKRGTIAASHTFLVIDSAVSQFFINLNDNQDLDHRDKTPRGFGYTVFGRVRKGMDVVDKISAVKTKTHGHLKDVPVKDIIVMSIKIVQ